MEWYHKIFLILKILFIFFYVITKFVVIPYHIEIEYVIEDMIKLMVCIFSLYLFWPFRSKYQIKKHNIIYKRLKAYS